MRLILLGPPGCGKGTQAQLLSTRHHLEHIGTGDILRDAVRCNTPAGARAHSFIEAGQLVPDDLVNDVIAEHFRENRPTCFVMDGYPRTLAQAAAFDQVLLQHHSGLDTVVSLAVPDSEIVRRLHGRWSCPRPGCKATYHTESNPPRVPGICDRDGTVLVQREDDKEETVRARLVVYHRNTEELVPHYLAQRLLYSVDGTGSIEEVYGRIVQALKQASVSC